ncbi:DUF1573 domain-containing protein [Taibaiella soli]|uniref:DUF1573 domain-containing protein n=1 Tax=Taibaiella soli TaxID=1649169 RepID=A0A2W2BTA9_9BACT|nr:DUF1573 domain-containing protein [Taibaiella soli]PZF71013.1 hypothetical protein DN068_20125 [Taibaiella soli]
MKLIKNILLVTFATGALAACNSGKNTNDDMQNKNLLSTDLVHNPHSADGTDSKTMEEMPTMDFVDTFHNFGTVHEGEIVEYDFAFKNNGKSPLIIAGAMGSCGCTVPEYPREPIQPGQPGVMKVKFNTAGKPNHQEKTVTINTNGKRGTLMLYIKAEVIPAENN